jgi:uncharacterized phiE125 gp8 family phage protein
MTDNTPPAEPLTLPEAKYNLRIDDPADAGAMQAQDAFITGLIVTAREVVEDQTELVLTPRTVIEALPNLRSIMPLAAWPITSVTEISYLDPDGEQQTIANDGWYIADVRRPAKIMMKRYALSYHTGRCTHDLALPVAVIMQAGYATPDLVPSRVKHAMQLLIGTWFVNREADVVGRSVAAVELPTGVERLLRGLALDLV